jgi:hypothetical protein
MDVADLVLRPPRGFVPILGREDVEPPVSIEIGYGNALTEPRIDHLDAEGNIRRAAPDRVGGSLARQLRDQRPE